MNRSPFSALRFVARLVFALVTAGAAAADAARGFRAGAARGDITPDLGIMIVGGFSPYPAKHIHDPLYVRALVFDDGKQRIAFAICDNLGMPREVCDEARRLTAQLTGIPASHVLVAGTHTHSAGSARPSLGPATDRPGGALVATTELNAYQRMIARRVADTVQCAVNNLTPAKLGWGAGSLPSQVFNRRWHVKSEDVRRNPFGGVDTVRMNPPVASPELIRPAGPTDPEITFLSVQTTAGRPLALFANYSLHYVGGVMANTISADYFGCFSSRIEELLGAEKQDPPFVGILTNGTSGDINNNDVLAKRAPKAPYEAMRAVANEVAAEVLRAAEDIQYRDTLTLDARALELPLAARRPTPEMVARARDLLAKPAGPAAWHPNERVYAERVLQIADLPADVTIPLQAFRLGDLGIAAIPCEVFAETGLELKATTPFAKSFTLEIANGYYGYLPTPPQHKLGGYETWIGTNRLEVDASVKIVAAIQRMWAEMKPEAPLVR
ncbi:MAG: neutral/alkaline non-lysosomal ceramidase N-terminal domain-containing protein [Verrucomicrobia bacterium]|nr:neutral/alkaline non-lysosomal ceramidase N-terminal domain-containing protein [Verrucomicrobiota bacterium]